MLPKGGKVNEKINLSLLSQFKLVKFIYKSMVNI